MGIMSYRGKDYSYSDAVGIETTDINDIEEIKLLPLTKDDLFELDLLFHGEITPVPRPPESFLTHIDIKNLENNWGNVCRALNLFVPNAQWDEATNIGDGRPYISIKNFSWGKYLDTIVWTYFDRYGRVVSQEITDYKELFEAIEFLYEKCRGKPNAPIKFSGSGAINETYHKLKLARKASEANVPRWRIRNRFVEEYKDLKKLYVKLKNGEYHYYYEYFADFDVLATYDDLKRKIDKFKNSDNQGEANVEYVLKWTLATNPELFIPVVGDCESKYRLNCILLRNRDFINESQEFDHLLVSCAGVISIETKHWKDRVEIRQDGKWIRHNDDGAHGVESPKLQIQRHEALLKSILPDVPIFSLLCFSHASIVIDGKENFTTCPIITTENLGDALQSICSTASYSVEDMNQIIAIVESYKTNTVTDTAVTTKKYWEEHAEQKALYKTRVSEIDRQLLNLADEAEHCSAQISQIRDSEPPLPPLSTQLDEMHRRINHLEVEKATAGLFARKRKQELQSQIEALRQQHSELSETVSRQRAASAAVREKQLTDLKARKQSINDTILTLERERFSIFTELRKKS